MSPEELVQVIRKESCDKLIEYYRKSAAAPPGANIAWNELRESLRAMSSEQQDRFWCLIAGFLSDSASSVLSILDNQTFPKCQTKDLVLTEGEVKLNGDLLDMFLALED